MDDEPPAPHEAQWTDQEECEGAEDCGAHADRRRASGRVEWAPHRHRHAERQEHEDQQEDQEHDGERFQCSRILAHTPDIRARDRLIPSLAGSTWEEPASFRKSQQCFSQQQ